MTDMTKEEITTALTLLKHTLVNNGMSIGITKDKELMFFDTNHYIETGKYDGFVIKIEALVK